MQNNCKNTKNGIIKQQKIHAYKSIYFYYLRFFLAFAFLAIDRYALVRQFVTNMIYIHAIRKMRFA